MSGPSKEDLIDVDFIDAVELASDGTTQVFTGVTVVSTTSTTKRVVLSGVDIRRDDERLEASDKVILTGTTTADGTYTINTIIDDVTFNVVEALNDSTGGNCEARHPPGAKKIGVDPTNLTQSAANDLQQVLEDLDAGVAGGGLTEQQHDLLDDIVHDLAETYYEEIIRSSGRVTSVIAWETSAKLKKVRETIITRSSSRVSQVDVVQYNSVGTENQRMVGVMTRSSGRVTSIDWTETGG